jgi:hypothetical protein
MRTQTKNAYDRKGKLECRLRSSWQQKTIQLLRWLERTLRRELRPLRLQWLPVRLSLRRLSLKPLLPPSAFGSRQKKESVLLLPPLWHGYAA